MASNRSAMVDGESNLSAAAQEERTCFPLEKERMAAPDGSEEEGSSLPTDSVVGNIANIADLYNARYACYFGPFEDTRRMPKKPSQKLAADEETACFPVETESSDESETEEDSLEELGPDPILDEQASCFRAAWNKMYSHNFGHFEDTTKIPNMRFTFKKPEMHESPVPTATLQIFSVKVAKTWGGLQWPLHVFGKVAVRDVVDHNRNMIFHRPRESCQILTQEDPCLKLAGPTRAVVLVDPVTFEVDLQVKGVTQDEDKSLSFLAVTYNDFTSFESRLIKRDYASKLSTVEFKLGSTVISVEATIFLKVRQGSGLWPDDFRARFTAGTASIGKAEVILLDSGDERVHIAHDGSIELSRRVVSVETFGRLKLCVEAMRGEKIVLRKAKSFKPKKNSVSHRCLCLDFCKLDVTVAWSLVSTSCAFQQVVPFNKLCLSTFSPQARKL